MWWWGEGKGQNIAEKKVKKLRSHSEEMLSSRGKAVKNGKTRRRAEGDEGMRGNQEVQKYGTDNRPGAIYC